MNSVDLFRLIIFFSALLLLATWELVSPHRHLAFNRVSRWPTNFGLSVINTLALKIVFPGGLVLIASWSTEQHIGLFHRIDLPSSFEILVSVLILDVIIYFQHRLFHAIPMLWRLHRVHHSDKDFDVSTAIRFHPIEIILSTAIKIVVIVSIGIDVWAVMSFEIILSTCALFNHSNILINENIDRWLRLFLVTPDMHRIHHSVIPDETNSNYGFSVSFWDRFFRSYCQSPRDGHQQMKIGLNSCPDNLKTGGLLQLPFVD